jgi:hypothetical protein
MKFVLLLVVLMSSSAMACPIALKLEKNQTSYSLEDFNQFLNTVTRGRYVIRQSDYKYLISLRLTKRSLYEEPEEKIAMVAIDVYDTSKKLISHSMVTGSPSKSNGSAFSFLQYQLALIKIVKEFPRCVL